MIGAIYRNELRANRLVLVALPLLSLAMYGGIRYLQHAESSRVGNYNSILADAFAGAALITLAAAALAIGALHVARDTSQAQWAFLVHRPASPGAILLGKLASALTLYFAVTLPPVAAIVLWAATPGNLPGPWDWGMARPIMVDLLCGTTYLLAGMLIILREARWFGTRLFPVGFAVTCTFLSCLLPFWAALLVVAIGWAILLPVTWSAMATRYRPSTQRTPSRFATGVTLAPASILVTLLSAAAIEICCKSEPPPYLGHNYTLTDGQVLDTSYEYYAGGVTRSRVVITQQDQLQTDSPKLPYKPLEERMQSTTLNIIPHPWNHRSRSPSYRTIRHYLVSDMGSRQDGYIVWHYMFSRGYIVLYKHPIRGTPYIENYIGRNGMSTDLAQVEPFSPDARLSSSAGLFVIEPQRIYETHQTPRHGPIFAAPPGEICRDASYLFSYNAKPEDTRTNYAIATDKALYLIDDTGRQLWRMPHVAPGPAVSVAITPDPNVYMALYQDRPYSDGPATFVRFRADGTKLAQLELPAAYSPPRAAFTVRDLPPLTLAPPFVLAEGRLPRNGMLVLLAQAVVAAVAAIAILRRAHASRPAIAWWVAIALLGGVAGLILMAGARHWPLRIRCAACGHSRRAETDRCGHCGAVSPAPEPGPIGVFDRSEAPVHV